MNFPRVKSLQRSFAFALILMLVPTLLLAATESQAIEKLKQIRAGQNQQLKLESMKANSYNVSGPTIDLSGAKFNQELAKQKSVQKPELSQRRGPNFHRIDHAINETVSSPTLNALPTIIYGSGMMASYYGAEFFNFYTGINGHDSTDMDVKHTTNEYNNFGDEGAGWTDPSLLYWLSPDSSLDSVDYVDPIDDPNRLWTTVSWDWQGGNSGGYMNVGEIWVVYTRTTNLYVVMEITSIDSSGGFPEGFQFDYKIQTDGTNLFGGTPSPPPPADTLGIAVNGKDADTLLIGSEPFFSIQLGSSTEGELVIFWDRNHNGMTDTMDIPVESYEFVDNDMHDLNPADSIFEFIYDNEMADGLNRVTDDFVFTVYADDKMADAAVRFEAEPSPWTITGTVRDTTTGLPIEGIIVWGDYMYYDMGPMPPEGQGPTVIAVTDTLGQYVLTFPDTGYVMVGSWDHLLVTEGQFPVIPEFDVMLYTAVDGVDFWYRDPDAWIEGTVLTSMSMPLADVRVEAELWFMDSTGHQYDDGGPSFEAYTDENGFYRIGVDYGDYKVEVAPDDLVPDYMVPHHKTTTVMPGPYPIVDFLVIEPNSTIGGTVYLDDVPYSDAWVIAWSEGIGFNVISPKMDGSYLMPVYDPPVPASFRDTSVFMGYDFRAEVNQDDFQSPVLQISENWGVMPGDMQNDIMLATLSGGMTGTFRNLQTDDPIVNDYMVGMQAMSLDDGMYHWTGADPMDGSYTLWLPPGLYEITAGGMEYHPMPPDTVMISDFLLQYDIMLDPVVYNGIFAGRVLDDVTSLPIAGADIEIGNEHWGNLTTTGPDGYFHLNMPNGYYHYRVSAEGYLDTFGDVDIQDNQVNREIRLKELVIDGAIMGYVVDGRPVMEAEGIPHSPIAHAWVNVWNPATEIGFHMMTDSSGAFWFDLPNGIYDIYVDHPDFLPLWDSGLWVSNDTLEYIAPLMPAEGYISGMVFDGDDGHPIWDAHVAVIDQDSLRNFHFYSGVDDSGRFHIPVAAGNYDVFVDAPGYNHAHIPDVFVNFNDVWLDVPLMKRPFEGPMMHFVFDQPYDQGRWVRLMFGPEDDDWGKYMAYSIWRMTNTPLGAFYDFIAYVPNRNEPFYNLVAPTLVDSNAYTTPEQYTSTFMVTGHYDQWHFVDGAHGFGWSVDNIHPRAPDGLLGESQKGYNLLTWNPSLDADFQYFEVFRSETDDFSTALALAQLVEPTYTDNDIVTDQEYFYLVKAVDANGNESEGSIARSIVSVDEAEQLPEVFSLSQNYPNPFNPTTVIDFTIPEASDVTLEIYNIRGQRVRTLYQGHVPAGFYSSMWDGTHDNGDGVASGTYIYLMKAGDQTFTKKMVYMK